MIPLKIPNTIIAVPANNVANTTVEVAADSSSLESVLYFCISNSYSENKRNALVPIITKL